MANWPICIAVSTDNLQQWEPQKLFDHLYRPLQDWFAQYGVTYPWSNANGIILSGSNALKDNLPAIEHNPNVGSGLPDSYAVWVSEVMLQQTRREMVIPYYNAWLQRWPTLAKLAAASEPQVLKKWEGLGYYSRALNMLKCAQKCVHELRQTELPLNTVELQTLPGIGPYIAAAVASISGNQAVLALDTNVQRIFSRLYQQQPAAKAQRAWQQQHSRALALCSWRGYANMALIQLGQQLCKAAGKTGKPNPNSKSSGPRCHCCPLEPICPAAAHDNWASFPAAKVYKCHKLQSRRLLLCAEGKYLLQRKRSGHLRLLWRLPQLNELVLELERNGNAALRGLTQIELNQTKSLGSFRHCYLHFQEKIEVLYCSSESLCCEWNENLPQDFDWLWADDLSALILAGPYRKFLQKIPLQQLAQKGQKVPQIEQK